MSGFFKKNLSPIAAAFLLLPICGLAQDIALPPPQKTGGMPLMDALNNRKSSREFSDKQIPLQVLSDLLWAAYGYNRPEQKMRTVPSAWNVQNINVYVALANGLYLYDALQHCLKLILQEDIKSHTGTQSFVKDAAMNLVYVADLSMMAKAGERKEYYSIAHVGFISQNVYLYCTSSGLATVVRDLIDRNVLKKAMNLGNDMEIILAQTVGYPKDK